MAFALCFFRIGLEWMRARVNYSCKDMSLFVSLRHLVKIRMWVQIKPKKKSTCEAMDFALCFFGIGLERVRARVSYS